MKQASLIRRVLTLALVCALSVPGGMAFGENETLMAYTTASLRLRQQPSTNAEVLTVIPAGDVVLITGESGEFYQAVYEGVRGYAMKQYLRLMGNSASAAVSPAITQAPAANDAASVYPVLYQGSSGQAVSALQSALKQLGYYSSTVDGKYGTGTRNAVIAFQKKNNLPQTGIADAATQNALYASTAVSSRATATPKPAPTPTPIPTNAPTAVPAALYPYSTYTLASVNLRKAASTSSTRLLTVPRGAEVSVLSMSGDYVRVTYNGKTGYLVAEYVYVPAQYLPGKSLQPDSGAQQNYAYLQSGASGKNVTLLQKALKELGFYAGTADGVFSAGTLAAVKAFQKKNGLKQDGVASPEVQKLIFEGRPLNAKGKKTDVTILPNIANVDMKLNDQGDQVAQLQRQLKDLGFYTGEATGVFNAATQSAVKKFQAAHYLTVDGMAGAKTLLLINTLTATPTPAPYVPVVTAAPSPTATPLTKQNVVVLRSGVKHLEVVKLQNRLMELGYYTCLANGVYDSDEVAAVKEFQRKNGLVIDGIAGLDTQLKLYSDSALPATTAALPVTAVPTAAPTATPEAGKDVLGVGSTGTAVREMQEKLKKLGYYTGTVDGIYGAGTAQAVSTFQRAKGLSADGVAGVQTLSLLAQAAAAQPQATSAPVTEALVNVSLLRTGDSGTAVRAMQKRLVTLGYLTAADGIYGPRTYNAVVAFQKKNGLTADGVAGKMTLNRLNSASAIAANAPAYQTAINQGTAGSSSSFRVPAASEVRNENWYTSIRPLARSMPDVVIYDPDSGLRFNLHMFSFGKHADSETPTAADTEVLNRVCGVNSWTPKYVWVIFPSGAVYIASIHSHGHEVDHTAGNNLNGHICLHFPRVMSEAEATGPYAVSHQKEILWGWELTQAKAR